MKKAIALLLVTLLCVTALLPITVSAAGASATLTGPAAVRAGDTITLTLSLNGSGLYGASGTLSYDANQVTLTGTKQVIASPWMVEFNGNNFVAYDNNLTNPIKGNTALFTLTFKVKNVAEGTAIKIAYTGVTASDGSADANVGTVTYQKNVAAPLSGNNELQSLTVSNATISPAFSAGVTDYTAEVPFEVSKLQVAATAADAKAKVTVNSPNLTPNGTTKVTVTVTAESGAKKVYTISVKRANDPNYVASGNNALSNIKVDGFLLSPAFDKDTTQYVVWLPYETTSVNVTGTAADKKASVETVGGDSLAAGQDNTVKVICTAENGDKKQYTVIVKRAAAHDGTVDDLPQEPSTDDTPNVDAPTDDTPTDTEPKGGIAWWWLLIVGVLGLALGAGAGLLIGKSKK